MPTTAATYVSHIRGWHEIHTGVKLGLFHNSDTKQGSRFSKLIRGLKHQTGYKVGRKKAVLLHHVADLIQLYKNKMEGNSGLCIAAALATAFQGLLRKSEYTEISTKKFSPERSLTRASVKFWPSIMEPTYCELAVLPSKTDPDGSKLCPIMLPFSSTSPVNACAALRAMVMADPVPQDQLRNTPLFKLHGKPLQGAAIHKLVQDGMKTLGFDSTEYGSHSLRSGGATALAEAGCPESVLKAIGRWSSEVYVIYCRSAFQAVIKWGKAMASVSSVSKSRQQFQ
jgi:hypothetical protein